MVHLLELVTVSLQGVLKLAVKTSKNNLQALRLCSVMRKMEMIENLKNSGSLNNSPCQYHRKCLENCMENMHTDIRL